MSSVQVPFHWTPRDYQIEFMRGMETARFGVLEWSRRAGKDLTCFNWAVIEMVKNPINVVYVFPTKEQGYISLWNNIENDGFKTIEHIPKQLIAQQTNTVDNMKLSLLNGSTLSVVGATNPDALRGANGKIYIISEFVDVDSEVLGVIRPIVAVNGGRIVINSTPKLDGISGGTFLSLYEDAENDPTKFASKVYATEYMTDVELENVRQDYIAQYGNDFLYRQEFLLDESAATATSYYGNLLSGLIQEGQVGEYPYNPTHPVFTSWDLGGGADSTAIWWWQYYDKEFHLIDAYETHDIGDEPLIRFALSKPYNYGWHFLPHDGAKRDSDAIQRIAKMRRLGLVNASLLRRTGVEDGIKRVAELLARSDTTFHQPTTMWAVNKLKKYSRKFNPLTGDYEGADHKTESHISDALRYAAEAIDQKFDRTTGVCYLLGGGDESQAAPPEELVTTFLYRERDEYGDYEPDDW